MIFTQDSPHGGARSPQVTQRGYDPEQPTAHNRRPRPPLPQGEAKTSEFSPFKAPPPWGSCQPFGLTERGLDFPIADSPETKALGCPLSVTPPPAGTAPPVYAGRVPGTNHKYPYSGTGQRRAPSLFPAEVRGWLSDPFLSGSCRRIRRREGCGRLPLLLPRQEKQNRFPL